MSKKIADNRTGMSLDEAKTLFNSIAMAEIEMARAKAMAEKRIAKIKADVDAQIASIDPDIDSKRGVLARFILNHPEHFTKPRNVKTSLGCFGVQKANKVEITDKKTCIEFVVDQGMTNCFKTTHKPAKDGIGAALEAGTKIPGAKLLKGDIAHYKVDKVLLDEAKEAGS